MKPFAATLLALISFGFACSAGAQALFREPQFSVEVTSGIVYGSAQVGLPSPGSFDLLLDLYDPNGPDAPTLRPGYLHIHGGGFTGGSRSAASDVLMATEMASRGYVAVSIDYRLAGQAPVCGPEFQTMLADYGGSAGVETILAAVEDAVTAYRWLVANAAALRLDTTRIAIGGSSAGAVVSLVAAYALDDHGIVELPEIGVVADLWGALVAPATDLESGEPPVIIVHGDQDTTVPFSAAQTLVSLADAAGVPFEFHQVPGAGHGYGATGFFDTEIIPGVTRFERVVEFFYRHLFTLQDVPVLPIWSLVALGFGIAFSGARMLGARARQRRAQG